MIANVWTKPLSCNGASACFEILHWKRTIRCNNGNCIEIAYKKATASNAHGECVEAAVCACGPGEYVLVRDSKLRDASPVLRIAVPQWWSFLAAVKTGMLATYGGFVRLDKVGPNAWRMWLTSDPSTVLSFDETEVAAFVSGVHAKEFDVAVLRESGKPPGRPPASTLSAPEASPVSV